METVSSGPFQLGCSAGAQCLPGEGEVLSSSPGTEINRNRGSPTDPSRALPPCQVEEKRSARAGLCGSQCEMELRSDPRPRHYAK